MSCKEEKNHNASCEVWTHDPWFTRPVLCHWAKEAHENWGERTVGNCTGNLW